jgi:hypothetical protein
MPPPFQIFVPITRTINGIMLVNDIVLTPEDVGAIPLTAGEFLPANVIKVASANIRNSHDAEATTTSATYAKVKTITLTDGLKGSQRFIFELKTGNPSVFFNGRIYRNGAALGTEQSVSGDTDYHSKSEDITQDWLAGDTCELWLKSNGTDTVYAQNLSIGYDNAPTTAVAAVNS